MSDPLRLRPPRGSSWLLSRLSGYSAEFSSGGDLEEEFQERAREDGLRQARRWFRRQAALSSVQYGRFFLNWSYYMFKNYLIVAFRKVRRHKGFSFLNIFGLALGLALFILLSLFVKYEFGYDRHNPRAGRIYRLEHDLPPGHTHGGKTAMTSTVAPWGPVLARECPGVEKAVRFRQSWNVPLAAGENILMERYVYSADPDILDLFNLRLLRGDARTALRDPDSVVLSRKAAAKYFGRSDPMGQVLRLRDTRALKVAGVFEDMLSQSHFTMDVIIPLRIGTDFPLWENNQCLTYLLLRPDADPRAVEAQFPKIWKTQAESANGRQATYLRHYLRPLLDIHLYSNVDGEMAENNTLGALVLVMSIALFILGIACVNYMNLATARSATRAAEIGVRKTVGALRPQLIKQFLSESVLMAFLALPAALLMIAAVLPAFGAFVERPLRLALLAEGGFFLWIVFVTLVVGLVSGFYPALRLTAFRPAAVLKSHGSSERRGNFWRTGLVVAQFAISIALISGAIAVGRQLALLRGKDVGYSKDQIAVVRISDSNLQSTWTRIEAVKQELRSNPDILAVSASGSLPHNIRGQKGLNWPGKPTDRTMDIYWGAVDPDFLSVYGLQLAAGRNFSDEIPSDGKGKCLLNETLVRAMGREVPTGPEIAWSGGDLGNVVGIIRDFNFQSLRRGIDPLYLSYDKEFPVFFLSLKLRGGRIIEAMKFIEAKMKSFSPGYPFLYDFFDDLFNATYRSEERLSQTFRLFSLLALVVAGLGLFGLAASTADQRTKEIGIRKILGASSPQIFLLLSGTFAKAVLLANLIACPLSYYGLQSWLRGFAYRVSLGPGIFLQAGLTALFLALVAVAHQSLKAAKADPASSLKYE